MSLEVSRLTKSYPTARGPLTVLADVSFSLAPGDAAAVMGPSGSGKSSLLYILGALEPPSSGTVSLDGRDPVSYANYAWTLGMYDRPWPERPIFGTVRTMTSASTKRKLRLKRYLVTYGDTAPAR